MRTRFKPNDTTAVKFFNVDERFVYESFFHDFGPINISQLYRYCQLIRTKLSSLEGGKNCIVHCTSIDPKVCTNAAWLAGGYLICYEGFTPEQAHSLFFKVSNSFIPFRDASQTVSNFGVSLLDCFKAIHLARKELFFDFSNFDPEEYEFFEKVENGDFNVITPKFIAFSNPTAVRTEICPGVFSKTCSDYFDLWRERNVTAVVRLNNKTYDRKDFLEAGFHHYDLFFADGFPPPSDIVYKFLEICENEKGAIAVHCKAGLGRTGTLIALYIMKHYKWTACETIAWIRIVRPGSVIGPQQHFLREWEQTMWKAGAAKKDCQSPLQEAMLDGIHVLSIA